MRQLEMFPLPEGFSRRTQVRRPKQPAEWKVVCLRDCPVPDQLRFCNSPEEASAYWRLNIAAHPYFNPDCECLAVMILNTRLRVRAHVLLTVGTADSVLVHPREVYRAAIVASATGIVLMHNHPSGDPTPSGADLISTREIYRAGELLRISLHDHIIIGNPKHYSFRQAGYLYP